MGWEFALPLPFPLLAFLFPCYQFISRSPGLPVMVCCSLPLSSSVFVCVPLLFLCL